MWPSIIREGTVLLYSNASFAHWRMRIALVPDYQRTMPIASFPSDDGSAFHRALNASGNKIWYTSVISGAYAYEPSCVWNAARGAVKAGALGSVLGAYQGYSFTRDIMRSVGIEKKQQLPLVAGMTGTMALAYGARFAAWGGVFCCVLTRIRGHRSVADAAVSGGVAGGVSIAVVGAQSVEHRILVRPLMMLLPFSMLFGVVLAHFDTR